MSHESSYTGTGIAVMVHLPDGSLFVIAGRVDVTSGLSSRSIPETQGTT
jgi:hypothetical protein